MDKQFYKLKVAAINKPIKEATCITFDVPSQFHEKFNYQSGQHLVIKFIVEGEEARRSYSLNSCPFKEEPLQVTVKRVKEGLVSNFVNDQLRVGDELEVMVPQGRFFATIDKEAYKTYFLFAAGSGITPIISILKSVLVASPFSMVHLFYGNANQDTIIFKKELETLQKQYTKRLNIVQTLSNPNVWSTWNQWKGKTGRINGEAVETFITENPPIAQSTEYYICGPGAMNVDIQKTLLELGIPKNLIHIEQFGGKIDDANNAIEAVDNAQLIVKLNDETHQLTIPKGKTLLETMKAANIKAPYSCESGVCGTCTSKITKGKVEMKSCMALDEEEIEQGKILTCQSLPTSDVINIEY